jgi:MFS transporter, DHA1 family, multidrug resistance protein
MKPTANIFRYVLRASPVYVAVFLMRFSFAFTVVALQWIVPSPLELGVISAAYPIMEMITGIFFGLLIDRIGRKWVVVGALLCSSLISLSFTFTQRFSLLVLIHALQGVCAAAIITATLASLADIAKTQTRGREFGIYDFGTIGGYAFGFVFSLLLIGGDAANADLPFYAGAGIAVIAAIYTWIFLKDSGQIAKIPPTQNLKAVAGNKAAVTLIPTWFVLLMLIGVALTYTRQLVPALLNGTGLVTVGVGLGGSTLKIGALAAVLLIVGAILLGFSQSSLGSLSDRFGRLRLVTVGQVSIGGIMVLLIALLGFNLNRFVALPFVVLFGAGLLAFTPAGLAELADIAPAAGRGSAMGFYSLTVGAGTVTGPLLGGELISRLGVSQGLTFFFVIGAAIMAAVLMSRLIFRN